jgi:hypothetical protein
MELCKGGLTARRDLWTPRRPLSQGSLARDQAMSVFARLSRFGSTVKERAAPIWKSAAAQLERDDTGLADGFGKSPGGPR